MTPRILAAALAFAPALGLAHDAPSGFTYDRRCCNAVDGMSGDCAPIPASAVRIVRDGFIVTLAPGDHPRVTAPISEHVTYGQPMFPGADPSLTALQLSPDGRWHACVLRNQIRCLYIAPGGS